MRFLTEHFYLNEFLVSRLYPDAARAMHPSEAIIRRLSSWCWHIGEPIRRAYRKPVVITSGYRDRHLNTLVGGAPRSQHLVGEAGDFVVLGVSPLRVYDYCADYLHPYQLICYQDEDGRGLFVHASMYPAHSGIRTLRAKMLGDELIHLDKGVRLAA